MAWMAAVSKRSEFEKQHGDKYLIPDPPQL